MNPVARAVLQAAVDATGAARGWLVAVAEDQAHLVAVEALGEGTGALTGTVVPAGTGTAGFVVDSGQPVVLSGTGADPRLGEGLAALLDRPPLGVLSVPCADDDGVVGALELADKAGAGSFTFDDVELATLLGGIAAVALGAASEVPVAPDPRHLAGELSRLAEADPGRYATVASVLLGLLGNV
jgi:GAF domain-containing protein